MYKLTYSWQSICMSNMQNERKKKKRWPQKGNFKSQNGGQKLIELGLKIDWGLLSRMLFIFTSFRAFSGIEVFIFGPSG